MSLVSNTERTCDSCRNYLSFKPIYRYPNGAIICGRCRQFDGGQPVWFCNIPEDSLFRCINRYMGCRKLLKYWEVPVHEEKCIAICQTFTPYACPICSRKEDLLPLLGHLKQDHPEVILTEPKFSLTLATREMKNDFIYYDDDIICNIKAISSADANYLGFFFNIIAASGIDRDQISIEMVIQSEEPKTNLLVSCNAQKSTSNLRHFEALYSEVQKCQVIECKFKIHINISTEFEHDFITQRNLGQLLISKMAYEKHYPFKLSGCRTVLMYPEKNITTFCALCNVPFYQNGVYKCPYNDYICGVCNKFDIEKKCEHGNVFVEAMDDKILFENRQFECRWSCGETDRPGFLNAHEIECTSQPTRKCPVSTCTFYGTLRKIFQHYQSSHSFRDIKLYEYWRQWDGGLYTLQNIGDGRTWHYFASIEFVSIYCELVENEYKFTMKICVEKDLGVRCFALIKHDGQKGKQVEDEFRVPTTVDVVAIKVFLVPKERSINVAYDDNN